MSRRRLATLFAFLLGLSLLTVPFATAMSISGTPETLSKDNNETYIVNDGDESASTEASHRLIVQLASPSLVEWSQMTGRSRLANGRVNVDSSQAQAYIAQLEAEQVTFIRSMQVALPNSAVSSYINEGGQSIEATYQVVLNAVSINPGSENTTEAIKVLSALPNVKAVYHDYAYQPTMYSSLPLINAMALWNNASVGGQANAGAGIKVASMDGGVHHQAAMFDGTGFSYPEGYPAGGLGDSRNNNGKIIASRAYFREWDPPAAGDENVWPGQNGTSHGVHTASTAAGNLATAEYLGVTESVSGVAPAAWVMSYRVFYASVNGNESFYTTEGVAALEDIVRDKADVLNNSWGEGPTGAGGQFDILDQALINATNGGVFVSMSAGNSGPGNGTTDHPSDEYIIVAASTTTGTLASGRLNVTAPKPVSDTLQSISFSTASFGGSIGLGQVFNYSFISAASVDAANFEGCNAWNGTPFTGNAALISRGGCFFSDKLYHAQQAGAEFVIVHNHANGGDVLVNMGCGGDYCDAGVITIPGIFIGNTNGLAMVDWYAANGNASMLSVDTTAFQVGSTPDVIISFSSRGPGVGNVLKPDIAAPGVNILAQGYAPGTTGEARHLGYGQVSGTSMASPHVAGAAALLRQVHPTWSNTAIKSAMMSTSKYMEIYNPDGSPAQPLDMGAGRLDLTNAADPGVILNPQSLSFGAMAMGESKSIEVTITSVGNAAETYNLSTLYTGDSFTATTELPGFTVSPASITLEPGQSTTINVTFDSSQGQGLGDNQGYVIMAGDTHHAHMAAWARVTPASASADVLIIDNDSSSSLGNSNYVEYYTNALEALGMSYEIWDADANFANPTTIPHAATLSSYKAVIYFTGDNYQPDGSFPVSTALTVLDMNRLTEYASQGGIIIAMGQDMSSVLSSASTDDGEFFYNNVLGANWLQDSVTSNALPSLPIVPVADAPPAFNSISLDLGSSSTTIELTGAAEVPVVNTTTTGQARLSYDTANNKLSYAVTITAGDPVSITAAHIHSGTIGTNGGVMHNIFPFTDTQFFTDSLSFSGMTTLSEAEESILLAGGSYINVHSTANPSGEVRGQLIGIEANGDGAGNQRYIDEIQTQPPLVDVGDPNMPEELDPFVGLLRYPGANNIQDGAVAMGHRDQPSLERAGISYFGRTVYTTFGLEGVNNGVGSTSREALLGTLLNWAMDNPEVSVSQRSRSQAYVMLEASVTSNITNTTGIDYRWDFGDGSAYSASSPSSVAGHTYQRCGTYTARVEATDSWGNRAIGSTQITVDQQCTPTSVTVAAFGSQDTSFPLLPIGLISMMALVGGLAIWRRRR